VLRHPSSARSYSAGSGTCDCTSTRKLLPGLIMAPSLTTSPPIVPAALMVGAGMRTDQVVATPNCQKKGTILMKTARFSFASVLLNCSERSEGSHGMDRFKSRPDCPVTWPNESKNRWTRKKTKSKPIHPVRGVCVFGWKSLSFINLRKTMWQFSFWVLACLQ